MSEATPPTKDPGARPGVDLTHRQILFIFFALMLGMLLAALDQTIVSAALPTIVGELGGLNQITWVVTSYLLTSTVTILLWGKLSDIYGRKAMFQLSIITFLASSALAGLSTSLTFLVVARGLQGVGAGGIMSLAFAIIGDILSARERGKYMGLMGSVFLLSSVVGPWLGGFLVDNLSWRWIFYINLPIGIPAIFITGVVPRLPFHRQPHRIDFTGAALVIVGTSALLLGLVWGGQAAPWNDACVYPGTQAHTSCYSLHWIPGTGHASLAPLTAGQTFLSDWTITMLLGGGLLLLAAFLIVETRVLHPLLQLSLFRSGSFTIASIVSFVVGAAMFGGFVFLPTYLQDSQGVSPTNSGFLLLPLILGVMPVSTASGIIISKTGRYKWWPLVGIPVASTGMLMLSQLDAATPRWYLTLGMFLLGAGIGMVMQVMVLVAQNGLSIQHMGVGTAANNFMRSMGSVFGVSVFGALFARRLQEAPAAVQPYLRATPEQIKALPPAIRGPLIDAIAKGVGDVFLWALPVMVIAFIVLWFLKEVPLRSTRHIAAAAEGAVMTASEETVGAAPPPPVLASATPADRRVGVEPADLRLLRPLPTNGRPPEDLGPIAERIRLLQDRLDALEADRAQRTERRARAR